MMDEKLTSRSAFYFPIDFSLSLLPCLFVFGPPRIPGFPRQRPRSVSSQFKFRRERRTAVLARRADVQGPRPTNGQPPAKEKSPFPGKLEADVVNGSSIGGLCCARLLARYEQNVLALESHNVSGGSVHSFEIKGCKFDSGPSFFSGFESRSPQANPLQVYMFAEWYEPGCLLQYILHGSGTVVDTLVRFMQKFGGRHSMGTHVVVKSGRAISVKLRSGCEKVLATELLDHIHLYFTTEVLWRDVECVLGPGFSRENCNVKFLGFRNADDSQVVPQKELMNMLPSCKSWRIHIPWSFSTNSTAFLFWWFNFFRYWSSGSGSLWFTKLSAS